MNLYYRRHTEGQALFVCCLQKALKASRVKKWFKVCGKVKAVEVGDFEQKGKTIYFAVVTFKKKHSVKRSMDNLWLSRKVAELYTKDTAVAEPVDDQVAQHIDRMEEGGFMLVTPKQSKSTNAYDRFVAIDDIDTSKRKRSRKERVATDFYQHQVDPERSLKKKMKTAED